MRSFHLHRLQSVAALSASVQSPSLFRINEVNLSRIGLLDKFLSSFSGRIVRFHLLVTGRCIATFAQPLIPERVHFVPLTDFLVARDVAAAMNGVP